MKAVHALICACLVSLLPAVASAELRVRFADRPKGTIVPGGILTLDVFLEDIGPPEDEKLFAYGIGVRINYVGGGPAGLTFASPAEPPPNFVFTSANFSVGRADASVLEFDVENTGELVDVQGIVGVARLRLAVGESFFGGIHQVAFDPHRTGFGSGDPSRADSFLPVTLGNPVTILPEPASLSLPLVALLALRRRRRV